MRMLTEPGIKVSSCDVPFLSLVEKKVPNGFPNAQDEEIPFMHMNENKAKDAEERGRAECFPPKAKFFEDDVEALLPAWGSLPSLAVSSFFISYLPQMKGHAPFRLGWGKELLEPKILKDALEMVGEAFCSLWKEFTALLVVLALFGEEMRRNALVWNEERPLFGTKWKQII